MRLSFCIILSLLIAWSVLLFNWARGLEDETVTAYYEQAVKLKADAISYVANITARSAEVAPAITRKQPLPRGSVYNLGYGNQTRWTDGMSAFADPGDEILYTWANLHVSDFLLNYLHQIKRFGITKFVIGALDEPTFVFLEEKARELDIPIPSLRLDAV